MAEQSIHHNFQAGVVTLQKLLIRAKADSRGNSSDSRGIYIISSNPANPEMYELKVQSPKDKNLWIQAIRTAVVECPTDDAGNRNNHKRVTADQKQKVVNEKQANIRDLIGKSKKFNFLFKISVCQTQNFKRSCSSV